MTKKQKLDLLREEIIRKTFIKDWKEVWFFPIFQEVPEMNGYRGVDPIIFIDIFMTF